MDWLEFPLIDLLPTLRQAPGCTVMSYDSRGALAIVVFNHLVPPFENPKLGQGAAIIALTVFGACYPCRG